MIIRIVCHFLVLTFLSLFSDASSAHADNVVRKGTVLHSASELDYPPFSIVQSDGTAGGFSVDLLKAAAEAAGLAVTFKIGPWQELKQELAAGTIDVLPLVSYSEERDQVYDFTAPYIRMNGTVFIREGTTSISSLFDLQGKEVLVMQGDTAHEYVVREKLTDKVVPVVSYEEAFELLAAGKHDAVVVQQIVGLQIIKKLHIANVVPVQAQKVSSLKPAALKLEGFEQKFCFAVREGDQHLLALLNEGLAVLYLNGTYEALYEKWFAPILPKPKIPAADYLKLIVSIVVPLLLIGTLLGLWYLKRLVATKTRFLEEEIEHRKLMEQEKEEANAKYVKAQELGKVGNWEYNVATQEFWGSSEAKRIYGFNRDALFFTTAEVERCIPERERVHQALIDLVLHDVPYNLEFDIIARDSGERRTITSLAELDRDEAGKPVRVRGVIQDITERKRAEEHLQESEQRHRDYIQNTPYGVFVTDEQGRYIQVNPAASLMTGYAEQELLAMSIEDLLPEESKETGLHYFQLLHAEGKHQGEILYRTKNGEKRWLAITSVKLSDTRFLGFCNDITVRKEFAEALKSSEEDLKESQRIAHVGSWRLDVATNTVVWSDELYRMYGFDPAYPPPPYSEHQKLFTPASWAKLSAALQNTVDTGTPYTLELETVPQNGPNGWMWVHGMAVLNQYGAIVGLRGVAQDITERKRAEEALRKSEERLNFALQMNHTGGWDLDLETNVSIRTLEHDRIFGYETPLPLWTYDMFIEHVLPDDCPRIDQHFHEAVATHADLNFECRIRRTDGEVRWIWVAGCHLPGGPGAEKRMAGIIQDITERKRAEEDRERLHAQLTQAQKMEAIGTLAGGIAHDFNNILGAILGYAEMAREDCLSGSVNSADLDQVIQAGQRAKDLVKQILAFSRQAEEQKIPLQAAQIVKESIKLLRSSLPTTIAIQQDIDPQTDLILADPTQLHQIVMNLCTNAYHAMEEKGGTLAVSLGNVFLTQQEMAAAPQFQAGRYVQLSIGDSGSGIPPEIQEKMFHPYFTTKETGKGTGMGLAIVHGIVKSYGGFVTCHSEVGIGTIFKISLPSLAEQGVPETPMVELTPVGTERILLVDDEPMLAEMGKTILERLGYTVTARSNSLDALATFQNQPDEFNLVITDQTMPGMTGIDLARRMLQIRPGLPIILCTGFSSIISEEKAKAAGIRGFALKPLAKKDIATLIRRVLDKKVK